MDKETEIKHLRALQQGDTYFAQFFKSDVDQMVRNIQNDFPIELGCKFCEKAQALQRTLADYKEKSAQDKFDMAVSIYRELDDSVPDSLKKAIQDSLGSPIRVIEAKIAADVPPTKEEVEYLIKEAKANRS